MSGPWFCLSELTSYYKGTPFVERGEAVNTVYLDFRKAFDTISQSILLEKLAGRDLDGCAHYWLGGWAQRVKGMSYIQLVASHK
ncbi:rna-directed dna polymerase from mobile element jockey-like [Willisornis vidua]|uniref:Rna-directed dna polymerase from mobile element jockey-like n=1 Tax=Willisornis vidua TaxID=1566151 RepID=A0ABQ9CSB5_9PASS|nr:rna-directed dna polymerase from mobile element jockey-like [Willisornis vidua]